MADDFRPRRPARKLDNPTTLAMLINPPMAEIALTLFDAADVRLILADQPSGFALSHVLFFALGRGPVGRLRDLEVLHPPRCTRRGSRRRRPTLLALHTS
jgi:hypothetical protein